MPDVRLLNKSGPLSDLPCRPWNAYSLSLCDRHNCKHKVLFIIGHQKNHILHLSLKITLAKITVCFDCGSGTSWRHLLPKLPRQTGPYHGISIPGDWWLQLWTVARKDLGRWLVSCGEWSPHCSGLWLKLWFNQTGFHRQECCAVQCFREMLELPCEGCRGNLCLFPASAHPSSRCYSWNYLCTMENAPDLRCTAARVRLMFISSNWTAGSKKWRENVIVMLDGYVRFLLQYKVFIFAPGVFWRREEWNKCRKILVWSAHVWGNLCQDI